MENSRRKFLKIAGATAAGVSAAPVGNALAIGEKFMAADEVSTREGALKAERWGMVIDMRKMTPELIETMSHACHTIHNVPNLENKDHEVKWIWGEHFNHAFTGLFNEFPAEAVSHAETPVLCNHCKEPSCVQACPTKATFKRQDGIVLMDMHRCIGCRFCMAACPYGARSFNFRDPRPFIAETNLKFPTRMKGVVEKCNFCAERLAVGEKPACVEASEGALTFGDLNDPASEVRTVMKENFTIKRKPGLGTGPSVYYIVGGGDHA